MGVESALTNGAIKSLFRRVRPEHEIAEGPLPYGMRRPITSSFPSGHATAAFTAAAILAQTGHGDAFWYALATVVAGSRVYVQDAPRLGRHRRCLRRDRARRRRERYFPRP